jgi:MFS family permease
MSAGASQHTSTGLDALRVPDFRWAFFTRLCIAMTGTMTSVGVGWQVYDLARRSYSIADSAFYVGMVGLAHFVAVALSAIVAGDLADRFDRRQVLRVAIVGEMLSLGALLWVTLSQNSSLWLLILVSGTTGVWRAIMGPCLQALMPSLVPQKLLPSAIAISSLAWQTAAIIGPALCGLLIVTGIANVYWMTLLLMAMAFLAFLKVKGDREALRQRQRGHPLKTMGEGVAFIRSNPIVLGALSLDLFAVLLGSATAMLPVFARDILHVGPEGLGQLRAAPAVGAAIVAALLAWRPLQQRVGPIMFLCVGIFGLCTVVFGLSTSFPLSLAALTLLGAADIISVYVRSSLVQIYTPDEKRGRVSSVNLMFISASNELGEFQSGLLASWVGAVTSVVAGGIGAVAVTLVWAFLFPQLRRIDSLVPKDRPD